MADRCWRVAVFECCKLGAELHPQHRWEASFLVSAAGGGRAPARARCCMDVSDHSFGVSPIFGSSDGCFPLLLKVPWTSRCYFCLVWGASIYPLEGLLIKCCYKSEAAACSPLPSSWSVSAQHHLPCTVWHTGIRQDTCCNEVYLYPSPSS